MTPALLELHALFTLLFSVFRRDKVWVVRLKTGGTPRLYPMARKALAALNGTYDTKNQEHIYPLDPQPSFTTWATECETHYETTVAVQALQLALERGEDAPGRAEQSSKVKPDKPAKSRELLTAVESFSAKNRRKLELWVGDSIMGHVMAGSNPEAFTPYIGGVKVHTLAPLEIAVVKLLEAAGFNAGQIAGFNGLILPNGSTMALPMLAATGENVPHEYEPAVPETTPSGTIFKITYLDDNTLEYWAKGEALGTLEYAGSQRKPSQWRVAPHHGVSPGIVIGLTSAARVAFEVAWERVLETPSPDIIVARVFARGGRDLGEALLQRGGKSLSVFEQMFDSEPEPAQTSLAASTDQHAPNDVQENPISTTEEKPLLEVAKVGDLEPLSKNHAQIILETEMIQMDWITDDPIMQTRVALNEEIVREYVEKLERGVEFKAVEAWRDGGPGGSYWLTDGYHRLEAHKRVGREWIKAEIRQGSYREAWLGALQANQQHGLRRSGADKRHAIKLLLADEELCCWSDRRIAEFLDVDGKTVASVRTDLEFAGEVKPQPVRKSSAGVEVAAKKSAPVAPSPALEFGSGSEPKPSLEHGSTQKDQRKTFNDVTLIELKLREDSASIREFTLGKITSKTNEGDMAGETRITLMPERFIYNWQAKNRGHGGPLQAKSWTGAVIELLGMYGIVSPDLVIAWVNLDGEIIPSPDIKAEGATSDATVPTPESSSAASQSTVSRVSKYINLALDAVTELRTTCSPRDIFDALEAHPSLDDLYRDLLFGATSVAADMSDALEREGLAVS